MLRIISGLYRNRKINYPDFKIARPTTDKVREAIFSSLQFKIQNSYVLDLFAGSGALAIEALSRGAKFADIVEKNKDAYKIINGNLSSLGIKNANLYQVNALDFLLTKKQRYDFIFLDAPYQDYDLISQALTLISQNNILNNDGEIILETDNISKIIIPASLYIYKERKYGKIYVYYVAKR